MGGIMKLSYCISYILISCLILFTPASASEQNISEKHIQVQVSSPDELQKLLDLGLQIELNVVKNNIAEGFISSDNLEKVINAGFSPKVIESPATGSDDPGPLKPWYTFEDIVEILTDYTQTYPDMVKFDTIGFSIRSRPILQFKIATLPDTAIRQRFFLDGACHGNEKIGTETVMRIIKELVEKYSSNQRIKAMVDRCEFVCHPIINIDGFMSGTNGRRTLDNGKDPNRAYGYKTGGNSSDGSLPYEWPEMKSYLHSMIEAPWYQNMDYHCGTIALYQPSGSSLDRDAYNRLEELYPLDQFEKREETQWMIRGGGLGYSASYGKTGTLALLPELCPHYPSTSKIDSLTQWNLDCYLEIVDEMNRGVRGRITDAATGTPLYARVQVKNRGSFIFTDPRSGAFHKFVPSPSGTFEVEVFANGFKPETKTVNANSSGFADINFPLVTDTTLKYAALSVDVIGVGNSPSLTENRRCLGSPDNSGVTVEDGFIIVDFGAKYLVTDKSGDDLTVHTTNTESYSVSVHYDVDKIIDDEGIDLGSGSGTESFDLNGAIDSARWVRIDAGSSSSPSIDAIEAEPREFPTGIIPVSQKTQYNDPIKIISNTSTRGVTFQAVIPKGDYSIAVYTMTGKKIQTISKGTAKSLYSKKFNWTGKKLSAGTYLIHVETSAGEKAIKILLIR
jgi:hypothetical protein